MSEIEAMVERTIATITRIAARVTRYATVLFIVAATICVGSFLLGLAALSDGIRSVWVVLGIVFAALAIGAAFVARWRVGRIRKDVPAIADEVRQLITEGEENSRLIIQELQASDDGSTAGSAIVISRRVYGLRGVAGHGLEGSARLTAAITAITSFPALALAAIAITLVFAFLGFIFLIALALG